MCLEETVRCFLASVHYRYHLRLPVLHEAESYNHHSNCSCCFLSQNHLMEVSIGSQPISEHCVNLSIIIDALSSTPQVQFMLLLIHVSIIFASLAMFCLEGKKKLL